MEIVSSYEWYKIHKIIILLDFMKIDYQINSSSSILRNGFHLYVNSNALEFVRDVLHKATMEGFLTCYIGK